MNELKLMLNTRFELINFEKIDKHSNVAVILDHKEVKYLVIMDLAQTKNSIDYITLNQYKQRYKAEKYMEEFKLNFITEQAKQDKLEEEKRRAWELFKNQ